MSDDLVKILRRPYGNPTFAEKVEIAVRIEELEKTLALRTGEADAKTQIIREIETRLKELAAVDEAQKLFNYYAVEVLTYGATATRLQNLENAWLNLKTQSELAKLTGAKDE